ncbi:THC0290_0291 family protein [Flavobacterium sp.]|jgi:hypothetical protein|uniref:THC0290_0291 family protein n=1 Tax=Flavobacterium sp. TaxID=239 RepID=UPI003BE731AA
MFKKAILFISIVTITISANAQNGYGGSYTEVGVFTGPVFFKSDYGERGSFENFEKNNGFTIGASYYLSTINNYQGLQDNFKLRLELFYTKADFKHYGKYVDATSTSVFTKQLRGMYGSSSFTSIGFQVEYYPFKTDDYDRGSSFSPYLSLGPHINYVSVTSKSTLGELGTYITTPQKYMGGYRNGSMTIASLTGAIGTRFKLADYHSLFTELRAQYFFSDWADGLNPNKAIYSENKSNDWCVGLNLGYIYYFN